MLIERHPGTAIMPKAHVINPRTMEIFAQHGIAADVYREGAPFDHNCAVRFYTSLGGDEPGHRRLLYRTDAWSGGSLTAQYRRSYEVRAQYLIAADGGKTIGPMVGIELEGEPWAAAGRDVAARSAMRLDALASILGEPVSSLR